MEPTLDIPPAWDWAAEQIVRHRWRKILVLGAVDRGKSTYCRFLIRRCLETAERVAMIDTDVGQKDIGPPATLTLGYPEVGQSLTKVPPVAWYFIGATSPTGHLLPMVVGVRQLLDTARATYIVINTTGFVTGPGRVLKGYKIEAVRPDVIVALEHGRELRGLLRAYRHYRVLRLPASAYATPKTFEQRRAARERAFGAYFATASTVEMALRQVIFQRALLFTGRKLEQKDFVYAEHTAEGILAVTEEDQVDTPGVHVLPVGFERHLLCGVANRRNEGVGLALIRHIDFAKESIALHTPVPAAQIKVVQFGTLYVQADGRELGHHVPRNLFA
jgi:polynucleotide 5'-hydroxyl-kinase GRC3/NOL9